MYSRYLRRWQNGRPMRSWLKQGRALAGYLLEKDLIDELVIYQSPHIMGSNTRGMFATPSWSVLADRRTLDIIDMRRVGVDTRITARISG